MRGKCECHIMCLEVIVESSAEKSVKSWFHEQPFSPYLGCKGLYVVGPIYLYLTKGLFYASDRRTGFAWFRFSKFNT